MIVRITSSYGTSKGSYLFELDAITAFDVNASWRESSVLIHGAWVLVPTDIVQALVSQWVAQKGGSVFDIDRGDTEV